MPEQERWYRNKVVCAIATGFIGAIFAFEPAQIAHNVLRNNVSHDILVPPVRAFGWLLLALAISASIVTRFWTRYDSLGPGGKTLAWAAVLPGRIILYVFRFTIVVVFATITVGLKILGIILGGYS